MLKDMKIKLTAFLLMAIMLPMASCGDDNDAPEYKYVYWDSLRGIKVTTTASTALVETISQAEGIVLSVNQETMDDVENLGLMRLWTDPPIDGSYVYNDVRYQRGVYVENLLPATTYYYRIVRQATSTVGNDVTEYKIMYGDVYSFTTKESNDQQSN